MKLKSVALILFFSFIISTCSKTETTYTIETIDGVRYVHNTAPLWGDEQKISLEYVQTLGGMEVEDENYILNYPINIGRDKVGNVYIIDSRDHQVKKYNSDGRFIMTIGKEGQGPGEFQYPRGISLTEKEIYVTDSSGKIHVFNNEGEYKSSFRLNAGPTTAKITNNDRFVFYEYSLFSNDSDNDDRYIFGIVDMKGTIIKKFGSPVIYENLNKTFVGNFVDFSIDKADDIIVTFFFQNRIEIYSSTGKLMTKIDRTIDYELEYKEESREMEINGRIYVVPSHQFTSVSRGGGLDHKGRFWVMFNKKQYEENDRMTDFLEYEIYDNEGILLTRVPLPDHGFDNAQHWGDRIYFIDPYGNAAVYEYKIVEK